MKQQSVKRKSIIHALNVFLTNPISIVYSRETGKYVVGYEPKVYRTHYLLYKIDRKLVNKTENSIKFSVAVDLNVREDFRNSLKSSDPNSRINGKTVVVRIIPTRYAELQPLYATIFSFKWRRTGMGGLDLLQFQISECPMIANSGTINDVCYKRVGSQVSGGGTHGIHTYIVISNERGRYTIGEWVKISNVSKSGRQYRYVDPITVSL